MLANVEVGTGVPAKPPKFRADPIPKVRTAGKVIAMGDDKAENCIKETVKNPGTPEGIQKFRKTHWNQPGIKQIHPGQAHDRQPVAPDHTYGKGVSGSDHVDQVIKAQNLNGLAEVFNNIKESKYASMKKEPLG